MKTLIQIESLKAQIKNLHNVKNAGSFHFSPEYIREIKAKRQSLERELKQLES